MDRWLSDDNAHLVVFVLLAIGVLVLLITVAARRWLREDEPARPVARMTADQVQALVDRDEAGDWMLPLASEDDLDDDWMEQLHEMPGDLRETGEQPAGWCRVCGQVHEDVDPQWLEDLLKIPEAGNTRRYQAWELDQAEWMAMARRSMRGYGEFLAGGVWADPWWTKEMAA